MRRITPAETKPQWLDGDEPQRWFDPKAVKPALYLPPDPPKWRLIPRPVWVVVGGAISLWLLVQLSALIARTLIALWS